MATKNPADRLEWVRAAVERFEGPLVRYAARITGDLDHARDVVQETFLRLCQEDRSRVDGHLTEWLYTVCRNRALDVRRKENRMHAMSVAEMECCASRDAAPSAELERDEAMCQVLRALATIPENQQEVIRLKFQEGLSYREISSVTGLSMSNVGFLIHTGLKTIRQRVGAGTETAPQCRG
ncbi:MAG: sigma-70 family RNA polymerase sigma factor [Planctomycetes bacterium]|nr:sigma-70 family RNA polymerase sigma factor [Planctomycetota bacterium]